MRTRSSTKPKKPQGVRLDPELLDRIRELAQQEQRTVSNTVRVLIGEALRAREMRVAA